MRIQLSLKMFSTLFFISSLNVLFHRKQNKADRHKSRALSIQRQTDQQTDRPTDRPTDRVTYRVAWTRQKKVSQLRFMRMGGLELKKQWKTAFLGVKSFCQIALIMFRVFNGKIRGNCNLYSLRLIIFWHSTPIMRKMCLKKLKKGCNWPFFGFFLNFGAKKQFW